MCYAAAVLYHEDLDYRNNTSKGAKQGGMLIRLTGI